MKHKREYAVGEKVDGCTVEEGLHCPRCKYLYEAFCNDKLCRHTERSDNKNVYFKPIEE